MNSEALLDKKRFRTAAFNHLLIVGMIDRDPLLSRCWGQEVHLDLPRKTLYTQGFGWFCGEVGIIRSDRNPFLHSQNIKSSECETVIIKISGTTPKAVLAALRTFQKGYVNALVPAGPYTRPQHTILDQDPALDFPGVNPPPALKDAIFAGWHQIPANEYREIKDATGVEPERVWRARYLLPKAFDGQGVLPWLAGFHLMAFGHALEIIQFANEAEARRACEHLRKKKGWQKTGTFSHRLVWQRPQPTDETITRSPGSVFLFSHQRYLFLSTLGTEYLRQFFKQLP